MDYFISLDGYYSADRLTRFIRGYKLTEEEIKRLKEKYHAFISVMDAICYYQEGNTLVYQQKYKKNK